MSIQNDILDDKAVHEIHWRMLWAEVCFIETLEYPTREEEDFAFRQAHQDTGWYDD